MTALEFYDSRRQFRRILALDWSLHALDFAYGSVYALLGFFTFRRVGHSQVYDVIAPFLLVSGFMIYQTWHVCAPNTRSATAFYYFNLPHHRHIAFYAHLALLSLGGLWLLALVLLGCALKLGGAGITAHYRIHPEMLVLPFVAVALTMAHVYLIRGWSYWLMTALLFIAVCSWFFSKLYLIDARPPLSRNDYWPEREMAYWIQLCIAGIMMGFVRSLIERVRTKWQHRQIGGIR